jgi:hypothetical protein
MQAYIEIEHSELFLKHFYGPAQGSLIPSDKTATVLKIGLVGITVDTHDAASGSAYRTSTEVNGEKAFLFDLTDGVDTYECSVFQRNVGAISATVTE